MTTEPVILPGCHCRHFTKQQTTRYRSLVWQLWFVLFALLETPTGKFRVVHIQRALREPPQTLLGNIIDNDLSL